MTRWEGPSRALAVNVDALPLTVHVMLLQLRHVVAHVVDNLHPEFLARLPEDPFEGLPCPVSNQLAITEGEIRRGVHGLEVVLPLLGAGGGASELPVWQLNPVLLHRFVVEADIIRRDLVATAARPGVDHDTDLPLLVYAKRFGGLGISDLFHVLNLDEVVAGPQAAQLWSPAIHGLRTHLL